MSGRGDPQRKTSRAVGRDPTRKIIKPIFPGPTKFIANTGTAGTFTTGQGTFTLRHY